MIPAEARLLRIYVNAHDVWKHKPLYQAVVEAARVLHLAGASVFGVELSFGAHQQLHDVASDYSSYEIPVVIEVVDAPERVSALIDELAVMVKEGLVTARRVRVVRYSHASEGDEGGRARPSDVTSCEWDRGEPFGDARSETPMKIEGEAQRLTVYVGSSDTWHGRNLAISIVERCRAMDMAGATVTRGVMGFGKHSVIHRAHILGLSEDLPEKIEVVDHPERIARLLPVLDEMVGGGLIVLEDVHVVRYLHEPSGHKDEGA